MAERKFELKIFEIRYLCDECGAEMKHDNIISGDSFHHVCENDHVKYLPKIYPFREYRELTPFELMKQVF